MPYIPKDQADGAKAPAGSHMAMWTDDGWVAIPRGATVCLVEDAANPMKIFPMVLVSVSHQKLVFALSDANGAVSEYTYRLQSGKPMSKAALARMLKNRQG